MKKVLSALVLSAAVVATAGQAYAYGDLQYTAGNRGSLVGVMYTDNTEIMLNLGTFLTENNPISKVPDHQFTEINKTLATVDYKSILSSRNDTGSIKMAFYLDDMITAAATPRYWDAYYTTTSLVHGGEAPTNGNTYWKKFNANSVTTMSEYTTFANGADVLTVDAGSPFLYVGQMNNAAEGFPEGSLDGINLASAAWGITSLDDYSDQCEIDMYLWGVRRDTKGSSFISDDVNLSKGLIATIRFNQETGAIILNAEGQPAQCPVPVPAAAWLLGSGVLGLVGLRRRK